MADNSLNSDVVAVMWTSAAGASTHEAAQDGKTRPGKPRKHSKPLHQEPPNADEEQASCGAGHEIDSFA